eukprot:TRINITY_DN1141_c0_g1_i2.p1 TRINITY_DN1141_c0_g1~~TRINITY_DN1141_c0_g1_i2.p1  ORF type:complete len:1715 (-),score=355.76 TRINITY_DN1141_c0_g1_i2:10-5154(-)
MAPPPPPMAVAEHNEVKYRPSQTRDDDHLLSARNQVSDDLVSEPESAPPTNRSSKDLEAGAPPPKKWAAARSSATLTQPRDYDTSHLSKKDKLRRAYYGAWLSIIERSKPKAGILLLIRVQVLPVLWLILDFFQVSSMFAPRTASESTDVFYSAVMSVITLKFDSYAYQSFVIALVSVVVAFLGVLYMMLGFVYGKQPNQVIANWFGTYLSLLVAFVYVPVLRSLFLIFDCSLIETWESLTCLGAPHVGLMLLAVVASAFFFGFICMVSQNAFEIDPHATHILRRFHGRLDLIYILIKTLLVFLRSFLWGSRSNVTGSRIVIIIVFIVSCYYLGKNRPYYVNFTNNLRIALFADLLLCSACGLFDHLIDDDSRAMAIVYWASFIPVGSLAYFYAHRTTGPPAWLLPVDTTTRFYRYILPVLRKLEIGSSPDIVYNLGLAFLVKSSTRYGRIGYYLDHTQNKHEEAKYYYLKALEADDHHATNMGQYAEYLARVEKNYDEAQELFKHALDLQPNHLVNLATYGNFMAHIRNKPREADEFYQRSVGLDPNHANYVALYSASSDGLLIMDQQGQCVDCNGALLRMFEGRTRDEFSKRRLFKLTAYAPGTNEVDKAQEDMGNLYLEAAMKTGRTRFEWTFRKLSSNTEFIADVLLTPVTHHGLPLIQASITDVTQKKKVEAEMQDRDDHMRQIQETMGDGIITIDENGIIKYFNPAAEKIFGYDMYEVVGHNVNILMQERDREAHDGYIQRPALENRPVDNQPRPLVGVRKNGSLVRITIRLSSVTIGDQKLFSAVLTEVMVDREEMAQYWSKTESPLLSIDREGKIVRSNRACRRLVGHKHMAHMHASELIVESRRSEWNTFLGHLCDQVFMEGKLHKQSMHETYLIHKDAVTLIPATIALTPTEVAGQQAFMASLVLRTRPGTDSLDPFVRTTTDSIMDLNSSHHASIMVSDDGTIILANTAFTNTLGYEASEITGHPLSDLVEPAHFHPDFGGDVRAAGALSTRDGSLATPTTGKPIGKTTSRLISVIREDGAMNSPLASGSTRGRAPSSSNAPMSPSVYSTRRRRASGSAMYTSGDGTPGTPSIIKNVRPTVPVRAADGRALKLVIGSARVNMGDMGVYVGSFRTLDDIKKRRNSSYLDDFDDEDASLSDEEEEESDFEDGHGHTGLQDLDDHEDDSSSDDGIGNDMGPGGIMGNSEVSLMRDPTVTNLASSMLNLSGSAANIANHHEMSTSTLQPSPSMLLNAGGKMSLTASPSLSRMISRPESPRDGSLPAAGNVPPAELLNALAKVEATNEPPASIQPPKSNSVVRRSSSMSRNPSVPLLKLSQTQAQLLKRKEESQKNLLLKPGLQDSGRELSGSMPPGPSIDHNILPGAPSETPKSSVSGHSGKSGSIPHGSSVTGSLAGDSDIARSRPPSGTPTPLRSQFGPILRTQSSVTTASASTSQVKQLSESRSRSQVVTGSAGMDGAPGRGSPGPRRLPQPQKNSSKKSLQSHSVATPSRVDPTIRGSDSSSSLSTSSATYSEDDADTLNTTGASFAQSVAASRHARAIGDEPDDDDDASLGSESSGVVSAASNNDVAEEVVTRVAQQVQQEHPAARATTSQQQLLSPTVNTVRTEEDTSSAPSPSAAKAGSSSAHPRAGSTSNPAPAVDPSAPKVEQFDTSSTLERHIRLAGANVPDLPGMATDLDIDDMEKLFNPGAAGATDDMEKELMEL